MPRERTDWTEAQVAARLRVLARRFPLCCDTMASARASLAVYWRATAYVRCHRTQSRERRAAWARAAAGLGPLPFHRVSAEPPVPNWVSALHAAAPEAPHRAAWIRRVLRGIFRARRLAARERTYRGVSTYGPVTLPVADGGPEYGRLCRTLLRLDRRSPGWLSAEERSRILQCHRRETTVTCDCGHVMPRTPHARYASVSAWSRLTRAEAEAQTDAEIQPDMCPECDTAWCSDCGRYGCGEPCSGCGAHAGHSSGLCTDCGHDCNHCSERYATDLEAFDCCPQEEEDEEQPAFVRSCSTQPRISALDPRRTVPMGVEYELAYEHADDAACWRVWQSWARHRGEDVVAVGDASLTAVSGWEAKTSPMPIAKWLGRARRKDGSPGEKPHLSVLEAGLVSAGAEHQHGYTSAHVHYDARCCSRLWRRRAWGLLAHDHDFWHALSERGATVRESASHAGRYAQLPHPNGTKTPREDPYGKYDALNLFHSRTVEFRLLAASVGQMPQATNGASPSALREHIETAYVFYCAARDTSLRALDSPAQAMLAAAEREGMGAARRRILRAIEAASAAEG